MMILNRDGTVLGNKQPANALAHAMRGVEPLRDAAGSVRDIIDNVLTFAAIVLGLPAKVLRARASAVNLIATGTCGMLGC
jgi:hypothetical protein